MTSKEGKFSIYNRSIKSMLSFYENCLWRTRPELGSRLGRKIFPDGRCLIFLNGHPWPLCWALGRNGSIINLTWSKCVHIYCFFCLLCYMRMVPYIYVINTGGWLVIKWLEDFWGSTSAKKEVFPLKGKI